MISTNRVNAVPLVTVRCDLCGESNDRTLLNLSDVIMETTDQVFRVARCRTCDLIYLNPRPEPRQIDRFYPDDYAPFARQGISARARNWLYRRSVRKLSTFLDAPRRVLDVGCGTGELLQAVQSGGNPNTIGVEPSPQAAGIARERYGLDVRIGTLERSGLAAASVDTVLMSHVIEHLPSPRATLAEVERVLKPGGAVIIWAPNARSLAAGILGRHWMGWDVPRHLYSFTSGTLRCLLQRSGFESATVEHERHGLEWAWGLRLWARQRFPGNPANWLLEMAHPALAAGFTPLGILSAAIGRSGRIRVIARKPLT